MWDKGSIRRKKSVFVRESTPEADIPSRNLLECRRTVGKIEMLVQQRCLTGRSVPSPMSVKLRENKYHLSPSNTFNVIIAGFTLEDPWIISEPVLLQ